MFGSDKYEDLSEALISLTNMEHLSSEDKAQIKAIQKSVLKDDASYQAYAKGAARDNEDARYAAGPSNTVNFLEAILEQNWIIIRKLDEISKKLDK